MAQHPTMEENGWDGFEVHPISRTVYCTGLGGEEEVGYRVCAFDDPNLHLWSVYARLKQGGMTCLAGCQTLADAQAIYAALVGFYNSKHK